MADISKSAEVRIELNGKSLFPPTNWQDVGVKASFIEGDVQPAITTEEFEFILTAYTELKNWIAAGNIFQGVPFKMAVLSTVPLTLPNNTVFDGYIDLRESQIDDTEGRIFANVRYKDDVSSVSARLQALDYGFLYENGTFTDADFEDLDYVVVKIDYTVEAFIQSITLFLMVKQLIEISRLIADNIATIAGLLGAGVTGAVASTAYAVASAIFNLAYATALLVEIVNLGQDLINAFVQPRRTHKTIPLQTLIEKVCNYLGYSFNTSVSELQEYHYLPSNQNYDEYDSSKGFLKKVNGVTNALPNVLDYGYRCTDMFDLVRQMFNGRFAVEGNTIQFHSELNAYWFNNANYTLPDILPPAYRYNTEDLKSNILVSFTTDITDGYTIENYQGTSYQVITEQKATSDPKGVVIENLEEIQLPVALASRKNDLNGFEKFLKVIAGAVDGAVNGIAGIFGRPNVSNLQSKVTDKIGVMKVETNNHAVPKIVYNSDGKLPATHRQELSAKHLWDNYINEKSFIQSNYRRQRRVYEGVEIPFGFADFQKLIKNSYFKTRNGQRGKITDIEWTMSRDRATVSYWIEERYTTNLKETYIEPS